MVESLKKNILIITKSTDHSGVQRTIDRIKEQGGNPIRLDTDLFPTHCSVEIKIENGMQKKILLTPCGRIDIGDLSAVYYRRFYMGQGIPNNLPDERWRDVSEETRETIIGLIEGYNVAGDVFFIDSYWRVRRADNKHWQLKIAKQVGIDIPNTLDTNTPAAVKKLFRANPEGIITKVQTHFAVVENNQELVVYTTKVKKEDLKHLEGLKYSPMTFQEILIKKMEYRVTIVGNKIFSSAFNPNHTEHTKVDWRRTVNCEQKTWIPKDLPEELNQKLLQFMNKVELQYGAIDIVETVDGRFVFLEVNACGEYHWLDKQRETYISHTIADVLMGVGRRTF